MRKSARLAAAAATFAVLAGSATMIPSVALAADAATIAKGKEVAFNRKTGNCLACHAIDDGVSPGDLGPPLVAMKARFPDRAKLRAQIWDATATNPNSRMPPFGKHKIISESDVDAIVDYLYTL
ncbi:MAG: sulfur oxidation c-type cytochrome SoxX [bacterium]